MADRSRPLKNSVLVEYANSPLILGSIKALRHSNRIIAFACLGGLGTEVFTVGISALLDKNSRTKVHKVELNRQLELREVPTVIGMRTYGSTNHNHADPLLPSLLDTVCGNYLTSWLYGGLLETMQATSTPSWSMDAWSFAPVDFSPSSETLFGFSNVKPIDNLRYNVTLETPAIRARLDCTPLSEDVADPVAGGWAFQAIGASLPADLPAVAEPDEKTWYNESTAVDVVPWVEAHVQAPFEVLVVSPPAVCTCVAVLAFLCPFTIAIYVSYRRRIKMLPRDVDTLANVLAFVYNNPKLLEWVQESKESGDWDDGGGTRMARLGEYRTSDGHAGWGVEIVDQQDCFR